MRFTLLALLWLLTTSMMFAQQNRPALAPPISGAAPTSALYDTVFQLPYTSFDPTDHRVSYAPSGYTVGLRQGQQWVLNPRGTVVCKADAVLPRLMGEVLLVKRRNHWGLVHTSGKVLLPVQSTAVEWYGDVLALRYRDQWHLFDAQEGQRATQGGFDAVRMVQVAPGRRLLLVQQRGLWGVLNERLAQVLPCDYEQLTLLPEGLPVVHLSQVRFFVLKGEKRGKITAAGEWVYPPAIEQ